MQLLDPAVRGDPAAVARLLHPDFVEIGGSGRLWDRRSVMAGLAGDPGTAPAVSDLTAQPLTADAVLVTYRAQRPDGAVFLRASVWLWDAGGWRVRFHQGTPVPPPAA